MSVARVSARVILLDESGSVLLFCGSDPAITDGSAPRWWFTAGGQVQPGERLADAATRELAEETGLDVAHESMVGPVWHRQAQIHFNGAVMASEEFYFLHRTHRFEPSAVRRTPLERRYIHGHRWCDATDIAELAAAGQRVYPRQLGELLAEANVLADRLAGAAADRAPQPRAIC